ncbi:MAG: hypothetical protein AB1716_09850 [Planctomycetota bacterium]
MFTRSALRPGIAVLLIGFFCVAVQQSGCIAVDYGASPPNPSFTAYSFDIEPIFSKRCVICHQPNGAAERIFGVPLHLTFGEAYGDVVNQPSELHAGWILVVPGDPETSLLYRKVRDTIPPAGLHMPTLQPPLSETEIQLIREWIEAGAPQ